MRWGGGRRQTGPVGLVHRKCVADTKWLSLGLKIAVTRVSQKNEKKGKGRTDLFLSLSGEHVHTWAPLSVRAESVFWKRIAVAVEEVVTTLIFMLLFYVLWQWKLYCPKKGHFESPHYLCTIFMGLSLVLFSCHHVWTFHSTCPCNLPYLYLTLGLSRWR